MSPVSLPVLVHSELDGRVVGDLVTVRGEEARHAQVKRLRGGEKVALTDGAGTTAVVMVRELSAGGLVGEVVSVEVREPESPRLVVVQAIPKGERGPLAVEMLTEVGADEIVPWAASRCVAVWRAERAGKSLAKWRSSAREAAKQSRRSWFPTVTEPASTAEVARLLRNAAVGVVLHEAADHVLADLDVPDGGDLVVVVGPEGGVSDEELALFSEQGAATVRMGRSVLRTSTAGVAAAAALLARTARWH